MYNNKEVNKSHVQLSVTCFYCNQIQYFWWNFLPLLKETIKTLICFNKNWDWIPLLCMNRHVFCFSTKFLKCITEKLYVLRYHISEFFCWNSTALNLKFFPSVKFPDIVIGHNTRDGSLALFSFLVDITAIWILAVILKRLWLCQIVLQHLGW